MAYNNTFNKDSKGKKGTERKMDAAPKLKDGWAADIEEAVRVMRQGGVILYPTDTVWGIGCDATNAEAVKKIYEIKKRDDSKAMICLIDSDKRVSRYIRNVPDVAWDLLNLPDKPTTVILDNASGLANNLVAEDGSIALRIPKETFSKELCYRMQKPIVSTSANVSGEPAAQNYRDIDPEPPIQFAKGQIIRSGVNSELDELREISSGGKDFLLQMQVREAERRRLPQLNQPQLRQAAPQM